MNEDAGEAEDWGDEAETVAEPKAENDTGDWGDPEEI